MRKATGRCSSTMSSFEFSAFGQARTLAGLPNAERYVTRLFILEIIMTFKKCLVSKSGQSVVEYIVLFILMAVGIITVFGAMNPEDASFHLTPTFGSAVSTAINSIKNGW
jgi:hypothetical protein